MYEEKPSHVYLSEFLTRCGVDASTIKTKHCELARFPISSRRKRESVIISNATGNGGYDKRLFCMGAAEMVLENCSH